MARPLIGFIGQGFVGKNIADDFETRGYDTVRYALEEPYVTNKDRVAEADIVFIAVPTPTTTEGFDYSLLTATIPLVGKGKIVVIKSTLVPGTTEKLQSAFPDRFVLFAPEFLSEATAAHDAAHPIFSIVGVPIDTPEYREKAELVLSVLPESPHQDITTAKEAELIKYAHNCSGYVQIIFVNMLYDLAHKVGADWQRIQGAMEADPFIPNRYCRPIHKSGRGAGGHCFIKDFAALANYFEETLDGSTNMAVLRALEEKNIELLRDSGKDLDLLEGVYGKERVDGVPTKTA